MLKHTRRRPRVGARLLAVVGATLAAAALALAPAAAANAHDYLVDSTPKAGSTQTTPLKSVSLTFNDLVLDLSHNGSSALLQVTGPDAAKRHFETGCPKIDGRVVSAPVSLGKAGKYVMSWQVVSADGHTVSNSIEFTYRPPAGATAAKGTVSRPECGRASAGGSAATSTPKNGSAQSSSTEGSSTQGSSQQGSLGIVITIAAIIVALAIIGVVVVLLTARRKPGGAGRSQRKHPNAPEDD